MKDIRIFVASSKELVAERNQLSYLVLSMEDEFERRGLRVRLSKWEYVDPTMTEARTEDRYLEEMFDSDGALILFRSVLGKYTEEEREKALAAEKDGSSRLKAHRILFKEGEGIVPCEALAAWRGSLAVEDYGTFLDFDGLKAEFLAVVDRLATCQLEDVSDGIGFREITAFLAADEGLVEERNAFADIVLNLNDLLARRRMRVRLRFYDPSQAKDVVAASEMGLVLYQTSFRAFGREEMRFAYDLMKSGVNPKRLYVFFRDGEGLEPSSDFLAFRDEFVEKLGHFVCQFSGIDTLRLSFLLSLERYAGEMVEIYSTVEAPTTSSFVGREDELRKLHGLFAADGGCFPCGRVPIVTGAGGQGKSELVRQYASQFRVEYPGGVFQVNMEHARTWDDVFVGLLNVSSNNGVVVRNYLALEERKDEQGNPIPLSAAEVRDALLRRAREAGPMLLFLDNVEDCKSLFGRDAGAAKAFPAGFSERVHVNVVVTARVCDTCLRPTDWAVEFPLGELTSADALELLLANQTVPSDEERESAARVAKLLGCRALYLQRVPALLGDLYADVVCDTYAELEKELKGNLLETVAAETDDAHLPGVLWKMTCERLEKLPLGPQCIKLAQMASFFSPEGFPPQILQCLWEDVATRDTPNLKRHFDRALAILERYHVFQSLDPVRMHRLDRAAILQTAKNVELGLEDAVGQALADHVILEEGDWIELVRHEGIRTYLPSVFECHGRFWSRLLICCPENIDWCRCHLNKLSGRDWAELLSHHPQLADLGSWEKMLSEGDWGALLCKRPEFASRCPLWETLCGDDLANLLMAQPQLAEFCHWENLREYSYASVFCKHPELIEWRCKMREEITQSGWMHILAVQPQFADCCPREVFEEIADFSRLDWSSLLEAQPQFSDRCPQEIWDAFAHFTWSRLLAARPQFVDRCPQAIWDKFDGEDWIRLLVAQPQFENRCPKEVWNTFDGKDWCELLSKQSQYSHLCCWEKLSGEDWRELLCAQPQFSRLCCWEKLSGKDWSRLLPFQPQFWHHCHWEKLSVEDWRILLGKWRKDGRCDLYFDNEFYRVIHSSLLIDCQEGRTSGKTDEKTMEFVLRKQWMSVSKKMTGGDWEKLLCERPQFANWCPWEMLNIENWRCLLVSQPQFAVHFKNWDRFDIGDWRCLLVSQPQFAVHFKKWDQFTGQDWMALLEKYPQFEDKCPWEKLELDAKKWGLFLHDLSGFSPDQALLFAEKCPWVRPLENRNEFEVGNGEDWKLPLAIVRNPSLMENSDIVARFEKLLELDDGYYRDDERCSDIFSETGVERQWVNPWAFVLYWRPELADRCTDYEKFSGISRCMLLSRHPQFADRWAMDELANPKDDCWMGVDDWFEIGWSYLVKEQPQFAKWWCKKI